MKNDARLIFVGGCPRSGTTLLQNILDSHPLILGGPEFLHLHDIIDLRGKINTSIAREYINIICTKEEVDGYLASFVEDIFLRLADKKQCEFYSEKTPTNILVFSELIELFPEAHFIQVLRDPRSIVSSMQQVRKRAIEKGLNRPYFIENSRASISYIKRCVAAGFLASKNEPDKVLTIVYEELLGSPEKETQKICKFLGIEWSEKMLYPGEKNHLGEQAITVKSGEMWYDKNMYNRNIDAGTTLKWQKNLTLGQQIKILLAFKDFSELESCGYDFSLNSLSKVNPLVLKSYYFSLWSISKIYTAFRLLVRKAPGSSVVKRLLSKFVRTFV